MTMGYVLSTGNDHGQTHDVIDKWLAVVDEPDDPRKWADLLNAQTAAAAAYPRLTDHDGEGWHLHCRDLDQALPHVLLAVISIGTSMHLSTRGTHRLSRCADGES